MNQLTYFASLAYPLWTGVAIIDTGDRHPMKASSFGGLRSKARVTHRLRSQIRHFFGFEASTTLARNYPYRCLGQSHRADKGSHVLPGQFICQVFRLRPSKFPGSRLRSCYSWVGESAGETFRSKRSDSIAILLLHLKRSTAVIR